MENISTLRCMTIPEKIWMMPEKLDQLENEQADFFFLIIKSFHVDGQMRTLQCSRDVQL